MKYGSVCSGIEAASVAWEPLGWTPAWFSEIEAFPSAVLAHHWPNVPNLGDMLSLPDRVFSGDVSAPDVLVGGTPCQAFSVAGARKGLADERGQLTIKFVELANAIDAKRVENSEPESIVVWENVPGVLSSKDNAFGAFLGLLSGEDCALEPPGPKWANAGYVHGPQRAIAWRVLDAQYFGVAQRRRRVFVVASARANFNPAAVLFEREGVRRDIAPSREAQQNVTSDAGRCAKSPSHWDGGPHPTLNQSYNTGGIGASNQELFSQRGAGIVGQAVAIHPHCIGRAATAGPQGKEYLEGGAAYTCDARGVAQAVAIQHAVCAITGDIAHALNTANNGKGCSEDGTGRGVPTIAQSVALRGRDGGATAELGGEVATCLRASGGGGDKPHVLAFGGQMSTPQVDENLSQTLQAKNPQAVSINLAVRRLTPVECERLQGFPDNHTNVTYRKKPAADGPRYKAIGNSMAVPCMAWIGARISDAVASDKGAV